MNRKATIFLYDWPAGTLAETDEGYSFSYDSAYLTRLDAELISLTLNGRKNRLKPDDWLEFAQTLGLTDTQRNSIYRRFQSRFDKAITLIESSFLQEKACLSYIELMQERQARIG